MDENLQANFPICADCRQSFQWELAYRHQDTPGSAPYNPPGHGVFRPRGYCPHCGALVVEWHIDRQNDYNEWAWFGDNASLNAGKPLPPNPLLMWGKGIPAALLPTYEEHQLSIEKIKAQEGVKAPKEPESSAESISLVQQGYQLLNQGELEKASQVFDQAAAAGLNRHDLACALGSVGLFYLWKGKNVEQAYCYCLRGSELDASAYWQMHYILSLIYEGAGEQEKAKKELADAHRYAGTRWWEAGFEGELKTILRGWLDEHGKEALQAIILTSAADAATTTGEPIAEPAPYSATKICPRCAEEIKLAATVCRFCQARFQVSQSGYCKNCHQVVEADANRQCPVCHGDLLDRRITSQLIEETAQPAQVSEAKPAAPPPIAESPELPAKSMSFWQLFFSPNGRIGRKTFFLKGFLPLVGFLCLVAIILALVGDLGGSTVDNQPFSDVGMVAISVSTLLAIWAWLMLVVKRFHDLNLSGWNILWWFIPFVGQIVYLVSIIECFFVKGREPNRFGINPDLGSTVPTTGPQSGPDRKRLTRLVLALLAILMILYSIWVLTDKGNQLWPFNKSGSEVLKPAGQVVKTARPSAASKLNPTAQLSPPTLTPEPYTSARPLPGDSACFLGNNGSLVCLGAQGWQTDFGLDLPFEDRGVEAMTVCPDGTALFMTSSGLLRFDGRRWKAYPRPDVSTIAEIACGANGEIWAAGYSGVARLEGAAMKGADTSGEAWTEFPLEEILKTSEVSEHPKGIALSPDGALWLALDNSLARYQDGAWTLYREGQGFNRAYDIVDVVVDSQSKPWAAYQNGLLAQQGEAWKQINLSTSTRMNTLAIDAQDRIWAGTTKNLWIYADGQWKSYNLARGGQSDPNVEVVAIDNQGRAWAGTHWGLNVVDAKGKMTTYHMHTSALKDNRINHILVLGGGPALPELAEEPPGSIKGKFTTGGQPLAKTRVEACMTSLAIFFSGATPCTGEPGFQTTTTDENGEFLLEDLPEGYYSVAVRKPGGKWQVYSCTLCFGSKSVLVSSGQTEVLDTLDLDQD